MRFLSSEEVLAIHDEQLTEDCGGGATGLRSLDLLLSAMAQPEATFGGMHLHETVWDKAAAYAFHLANNHPFVDANKRTALNAALTFLDLNGHSIRADAGDELVEMMVAVADGRLSKADVSRLLASLSET